MAEATAAVVGAANSGLAAMTAREAEAGENSVVVVRVAELLGAAVRVAEGRSATAAVPRDGPEGA